MDGSPSIVPVLIAERDMDDPAHQPVSFNDPVNIVPFGWQEGSSNEADVRCFWLQPVDPHCLLTGAFCCCRPVSPACRRALADNVPVTSV
jgi:hypothetical protein